MVTPILSLPLLAAAACIDAPLPTDAGTSGAGEAISVELEPQDPVLLPGQSIRFSALLRDVSGAEMPGDVEWEAVGGSIGSDGLYTAPETTGKQKVKVRYRGKSGKGPDLTDSTAVEVADPASEPPATQLVLSPESAMLDAGDTLDFHVVLYGEDGSRVAAEVEWAASGGTIDQTGRFIAGPNAGQFDVRASSGQLADTARIVVDESEDQPPANQPPTASFTVDCSFLTCMLDASGTLDPDGTIQAYAWTFGDGTTGMGLTASHTFGTAGTYTIGLTATDEDGASDAVSQEVTVEAEGEPAPPVSGVEIAPGTNIQSVVDAHPAGTTFVLKAGVHAGQQIRPRDGDTFHGEPGAVLDGQGGPAWAIRSGADDVTISGLEITRYTPPVQYGAVEAEYDLGLRWTVQDNEIHGNTGGGLKVGHDMVVRGNHIHHNGQAGLLGRGHRMLIEDNEISYNNTDGHDPLWEAGGMKFLRSDGIVFRNNHVHHNYGTGVWFDHDNVNSVIENNLIEDNQIGGIHYEISLSAVIRGNTIRRNGDGSTDRFSRSGILIYSSRDVEITGNTLEGNDQGITALDDNRAGTYRVQNLWVHDNDVTMARGGSGLGDWAGDGYVYSSAANNRYDRNTYRVAGNAEPFWHGSRIDESEWQGYQQDPNSSFIR